MTTKLDVDVSFIIPKVDDEKRPMDWRRERETEARRRQDFDLDLGANISRKVFRWCRTFNMNTFNMYMLMFALEDWSPGSR